MYTLYLYLDIQDLDGESGRERHLCGLGHLVGAIADAHCHSNAAARRLGGMLNGRGGAAKR